MLEKRYSITRNLVADRGGTEHINIPVLSTALGSWRFTVEREPLGGEEISRHYDRKASNWMRLLNLMGYLRAYRSLMRTLFSEGFLHQLPDDPWILDAGTGSGALSLALNAEYLAQQKNGELMFSGVDRSRKMLQIAQKGFDAAELNAALHNYDICQLPWGANTFDFAMAAHVIEHIPAPKDALSELVRVLQPGAPLLLLVTKRSFLGALVQMSWRVHGMRHREVEAMLDRFGLVDIQFIPLKGLLCQQMSLACIARKKAI